MFVLTTISESVRLSPQKLKYDYVQAIALSLNQKYCNRVILDVGLAISVFDVLEAGDPYVHSGHAAAFVAVKFRLIVFRPFVGQVLEGYVRSAKEDGIHVSLTFFDDIVIPPSCLAPGMRFDAAEQLWVWHYEGAVMFIDVGERIRFRVLRQIFSEAPPIGKESMMMLMASAAGATAERPAYHHHDGGGGTPALGGASSPGAPLVGTQAVAAPFKLVASIAEDGLGLVRWWNPPSDGDEGSDEGAQGDDDPSPL